MTVPGAHRFAGLLDRLLRPHKAAVNAGASAAHTTDELLRRQRIDREVARVTDQGDPGIDG